MLTRPCPCTFRPRILGFLVAGAGLLLPGTVQAQEDLVLRIPGEFGTSGLPVMAGAQESGPTMETRPVDRRFTFVEETLHGAPAGHFEYEQWVTWETRTREDSDFDRVDFKHELEYGITDTVHFAIEVANWHWQHDDQGSETRFDTVGGELKFRFLDPRTDVVGLGFKTEPEVGSRSLGWENQLIVDKIFGPLEIAYNLTLEAEWEGEGSFDYEEKEGELSQGLGVSYELNPSTYVGSELLYQIPFADWEEVEPQNLYLGPNVSFRGSRWAVGTTGLWRLTQGEEEAPAFQMRLIFEVDF